MQVIIIAAGEGIRMRPLTLTLPKPLVSVGNKTLLDHIFLALPDEVTEAVIVVRYLANKIKNYCGVTFHGRSIIYAEGSSLGSAYSFLAAQPFIIEDRFLFINGDEFPDPEDIKNCLSYPVSILCFRPNDPWNHGVVTLRPDGTVEQITEKPVQPKSNLASLGVLVLSKKIFSYVPEKNDTTEFFFTSLVNQFLRDEDVVAVESKRGIGGISTVADVEKLNNLLL
ncbi:MAG: hypothetical protein A2821_03020 [Candidatus Magasanikbacteria bacterium RIFCSPHIGHO2_01_FULL_41_23]|uniref:Nucleotidyl transferase domain-containing protein n=1 Tax=Candidatus Magasanikbacteria bacterium RIFCSPLOWO2_01_FULL_40_15 TaxID=1798686 RepID=A0A1F6N3I9_9BACT|nr:MAG: hypothetical protein A2821_03020 [Candidatus Magasanikbacteria bacterium RIFCSPHIGHO2_01_FULL_41_23]OGH67310.1 MAG: hypothetical protein A3C66_01035 [Candidatus Magasanikbacteria bacterium RIFCSPHIGHO2_02_FULL_41_35]OGH76535.1 MAG: hypothetical protein A3F22_00245 [Candidatus Magasanikbacteria bacterium RIFCSPHIGHO2_12_FULL_41_16]OGH78479.1 MAG: hypothetical protein A2983_03110 [Candidatus Magasanikbacteria bacterium RIFCSPLOWO2_01_FULL_40_15]